MKKWINVSLLSLIPQLGCNAQVYFKLIDLAVREEHWKVYLVSENKDRILSDCKISEASLYRALTALEEAGMINRSKGVCTFSYPIEQKKVPIIFKNS